MNPEKEETIVAKSLGLVYKKIDEESLAVPLHILVEDDWHDEVYLSLIVDIVFLHLQKRIDSIKVPFLEADKEMSGIVLGAEIIGFSV